MQHVAMQYNTTCYTSLVAHTGIVCVARCIDYNKIY